MIEDQNTKNDTLRSDEYDRETVEECRRLEQRFDDKEKEGEKPAPWYGLTRDLALYALRGERYRHKEETIARRRNAMSEYREKLDKAQPASVVYCLACRSQMEVFEKDLRGLGKKERILFYFRCPECKEMRRFFNDGEEYRPAPPTCLKCNTPVEKISKREGSKLIDSYTCSKCSHHEEDVLDLDEKPKAPKIDKNFLKDREKYCMGKEEGDHYVNWAVLMELPQTKEMLERYSDDPKSEAVSQIKKINIAQVEALLKPAIEKEKYRDLVFGKSEIYQGTVIVPFTVQDTSVDRSDHDSQLFLKSLINEVLSETNWRAMSDDFGYKLGLLSGRIRGMEREEDLVELIKVRQKKLEKKSDSGGEKN